LADVEWDQKLLEQDLTRMNRLMRAFHDQFLPLSVIVDDFDVSGPRSRPGKADSPLIIDSDAVLPHPFAPESLQSIPRGYPQIVERLRSIDDQQLTIRPSLQI
jgi:hypothetical protein